MRWLGHAVRGWRWKVWRMGRYPGEGDGYGQTVKERTTTSGRPKKPRFGIMAQQEPAYHTHREGPVAVSPEDMGWPL